MTATNARALVDTNLLVYCYDHADVVRQQQALAVLDPLAAAGQSAVSTQVIGEFFVTVIRKLPDPLTIDEALREVDRYLRSWIILDVTGRVVEEAVRAVREHQLNYWDAQIWAVARLNRVPFILSEDFQDGRMLEGVRFLNPLRQGFRLPDHNPARRL